MAWALDLPLSEVMRPGVKTSIGDMLIWLSSCFIRIVVVPVVEIVMEFIAKMLYQVCKYYGEWVESNV